MTRDNILGNRLNNSKRGLLLLLMVVLVVGVEGISGRETGKSRTSFKEMQASLKKVTGFFQEINVMLVTFNSYVVAFNNVLKEYQVVEMLGVTENLFSFLFSGEHLLTFVLFVTFFLLLLQDEEESTISSEITGGSGSRSRGMMSREGRDE